MSNISIRWKNYRGFRDSGEVELRPITIVLGANNSGKTALISPLVLLKQSLENSARTPALDFSGDILNFGTYKELVFRHDTQLDLELSLRISPEGAKPQNDEAPLISTPVLAEISFQPNQPPTSAKLKAYTLKDSKGKTVFRRTLTTGNRYTLSQMRSTVTAIQRSSKLDWDESKARIFMDLARKATPNAFLFDDQPINEFMRLSLQPWVEATREEVERNLTTEVSSPLLFPAEASAYGFLTSSFEHRLRSFISAIAYLGPLREKMQRHYAHRGTVPRSVGSRGEHAMELLQSSEGTQQFEAVQRWISEFGFPGRIEFESYGDDSISPRLLVDETTSFSLVDSGFGISQIVPLLVEGLIAPTPGGTIIAAQPEIHLNPALQARLADFFCEIASSGKRVIVETHSEHLILRLRRLIAEGKVATEQVSLLFVERNDLESRVRRIPILEDGSIPSDEWPTDFFDEPMHDSLKMVIAQAARLQKKSRRSGRASKR